MKRRRNASRRRRQTIYVWTHGQALRALPYIRSVVRSLRDHQLDAQRHRAEAAKLAALPGKADRDRLIRHEEAVRAADQARDCFQEALDELHRLDVYCLDPIRGEALVPFVQEDQLAWYVFDLFDKVPYRSWRFHSDPLETRRPLAESLEDPNASALV